MFEPILFSYSFQPLIRSLQGMCDLFQALITYGSELKTWDAITPWIVQCVSCSMVLKVEAYSSETVFNVQARFTW
jgi:hypothetical protein